MSDSHYVVIFSHSPQIQWFSLIARVLRVHFEIPSTLWVIGERDRLLGETLGEFREVVDLIGDKSVFTRFESSNNTIGYLRSFEENVGELCVNRDIAIDRYFAGAKWSIDKAMTYSAGILSRVRSEIDSKGLPMFAIGEENCLHYRFARRVITAPYFCAYMVGHWGERIYFEYTMYYQWERCQKKYQTFIKEGVPKDLKIIAEKRLKELITNRRQPTATVRYINKGGNSVLKRISMKRLSDAVSRSWKNLISTKEEWNPKSQSIVDHNVLSSAVGLFKETFRKHQFKRIALKQLPAGVEYAGYFLHVQPEHTVEGVAFEYRDQAATARNIAATLPAGMMLLVKEHLPMVGKRPVSFYKELCACPNILVLDDTVSAYEVVENSRLMFTLSGSVALESMYIGKPAIVLGKIYHTAFRGIYSVDNLCDLHTLVEKILSNDRSGATTTEAVAALAAMHDCSYPGRVSSQFSLEEMEQKENLDAIASALSIELALVENFD